MIKVLGGVEISDEDAKKMSVDLAHKILRFAVENCENNSPQVLVLACSHFLSHILMGAPDENAIKAGVVEFLRDLDVQKIIAINKSEKIQGIIKAVKEGLDVENMEETKPILH